MGDGIKILLHCRLLVLCKNELFYQDIDGNTLTTDYPVSKTAASMASILLDIPLSYDGGPEVDNKKVLKEAFK